MWRMFLDMLHVQLSWSYCAPMCPYSSLHSYLKCMHADSSISGLFFKPSLQANIPGNPSKIFMYPWADNSLFTLESGMNDSRILWNSPSNNDILFCYSYTRAYSLAYSVFIFASLFPTSCVRKFPESTFLYILPINFKTFFLILFAILTFITISL